MRASWSKTWNARRIGVRLIPLAAVLVLASCDSEQGVLDPGAVQPGTAVASIALDDALDRLVPAIPDRAVAKAVGGALGPLKLHLANADIVHARATLWHVTNVLDAHKSHPDPAVRAELSAVRLAIWVIYDRLKIPFGG